MEEAAGSIIPTIFGPLESLLAAFGLNSPIKRFLFTAATGTAIEFMVKPSYAFSGGTMRTPIYFDNSPGNTYTPVGLFPSIVGFVFAMFV